MPSDVRVLTIRQPWVWAILEKGKNIENRSWNTSYRGELFLHASMKYDKSEALELEETYGIDLSDLPCGAFLGTCMLSNVVTESRNKWFQGEFGFVLKDVKALRNSVPAMGKLSLWRPTPKQIAAVRRQLPRVGINR